MKLLHGLLTAALILAHLPRHALGDRFEEERVVVPISLGSGRTFNLRLPRLLPAPFEAGGFRRTYKDTCGLYDILHYTFSPQGQGPPPHLHYSDDEFFIMAGSGQTRMFSAQQAKTHVAGQLPGYNAPAVEMGSVLLNPGEVLYSPKGSIHYFVRETDVTDAFDVHVSGYAAEIVVGAFANYTGDPEELLYITGLYGGPTDITGQMVGLEDYRSARGPVATVDLAPELVRLQALFDAGEACFPESD